MPVNLPKNCLIKKPQIHLKSKKKLINTNQNQSFIPIQILHPIFKLAEKQLGQFLCKLRSVSGLHNYRSLLQMKPRNPFHQQFRFRQPRLLLVRKKRLVLIPIIKTDRGIKLLFWVTEISGLIYRNFPKQ